MQGMSGNQQLTRGLSLVYQRDEKRSSFLAADQWNDAFFPGHALHEKVLQRQKGVVPLVGSQEQRALIVPLINQ